MTLIIKSNTYTSPNNMAAIDVVRALVDAPVAALPGLKAWWRPDYGIVNSGSGTEGTGSQFKWTDMIRQLPLVPMSDTGPMYVASAFNLKPCLRFNTLGRNGRLVNGPAPTGFYPTEVSSEIWPASASVTLVVVAKDPGGGNTAYAGTDKATGYAQLAHASSNFARVQHVNPTNLFSGAAVSTSDPVILFYSYDFSDHSYGYRNNRVSVTSGTAASEVATGSFTVGTAGNAGSPTFRGDIYEILMFTVPMHVAGAASNLATLETYLFNRYGL